MLGVLVHREVHLLVETLYENWVPVLIIQEAAQGDGCVAVTEVQVGVPWRGRDRQKTPELPPGP